jgi:hypothetical protein
VSSSSSGGIVSLNNINVSNYSLIVMEYSIETDCGTLTNTKQWIVQSSEGTDYSIYALVQSANTYITAGMFGFDNFGKTVIVFLVIVLTVGGLSSRYGIASEGAIMGMLFGIVFFLDVGLGFIPKVEIGEIVSINHFFTFITFIILLAMIIREERR